MGMIVPNSLKLMIFAFRIKIRANESTIYFNKSFY